MYVRSRENKIQRWYFGGLASAAAACFTHPLDLIKVLLQTQNGTLSVVRLTSNIIKQDGVLKLYNGLSASLTRQLTYSTARFALYELGKQHLPNDSGFTTRIVLAGGVGAASGIVGVPADLINVRMQHDVQLPIAQRRNYTNVIDGWIRVKREEGFRKLFSGSSMAAGRGFLMTIGQIAFYDQVKTQLLASNLYKDDTKTHFLSSLVAGTIATTLTQPLDVLKSRAMCAKPGEFKSFMNLFMHTAQLGPLAFYKGYLPTFIRLGPHTVLTFVILEQLRLNFGYFPN